MSSRNAPALLAVAAFALIVVTGCGDDDAATTEDAPAVCPYDTLVECGAWAADRLDGTILWPRLDDGWSLLGADAMTIDSGPVVTAVIDNGRGDVLSFVVSSQSRDLTTESTLAGGLRYLEVRPTQEGVEAIVVSDGKRTYTLVREAVNPAAPIARATALEVLDSLRPVTR